MWKNYLTIAWRNLLRNKGFSAINLTGLTLGCTCTVFILLWVYDELTYDKFHKDYDHLHQLMANRDFNGQIFTDQNMVLPLAFTLEEEVPEIEKAVVVTHPGSHVLAYGDTKFKKEGLTVSEHFFDMFTWQFINGNRATALPDAYAIVLTQSTAEALFGDENPIDKIINVDNEYDAKVTAIIDDVPGNSTFQFDFINAFNYSSDYLNRAMGNWRSSSWRVFVQTVPGVYLFHPPSLSTSRYSISKTGTLAMIPTT